MLTFVVLVLLVIFWRARPVPAGEGYYKDYMDPAYTTAIKGVFILLIFLTHGEQYLTLTDSLPDRVYGIVRLGLGQSVVAAFFFYSGYGLMESLKRKGTQYLADFPKKRIAKTLVHFDLAVLLYVLLALALERDLTACQVIFSFIGWESVGNSAWFIFDISVAYGMFYLCFRAFAGGCASAGDGASADGVQRSETLSSSAGPVPACFRRGALLFTACSAVFVVLMILTKETRYYNTFLCIAMGGWFSLYKEPIERFVRGGTVCGGMGQFGAAAGNAAAGDAAAGNAAAGDAAAIKESPRKGRFLGILFGLAALYIAGGVLLLQVYEMHEYLYIPLPLIFMACLLLLTMVWRFDNPVLRWFGEHLFSVFILMRLPMIVLEHAGITNVYAFLPLAFAATVALAYVFDALLQKMDARLFA